MTPDLVDLLPILPRAHRHLILALVAAEAEMTCGEADADISQVQAWRMCRTIVHRAIDETLAPFVRELSGEEISE